MTWRARPIGRLRGAGRADGYTFIELLIVSAMLLVLASAVMPLVQVTAQRQREFELRRNLREMRTAIDKFKDAVDSGAIAAADLTPTAEGYPSDLQTLVDGVPAANDASGRKIRFGLRRVPIDPMTNSTDWGLRSYQDKADATSWGGQNVFDVYTKSTGTALNGTKYKDW
jgi:general secretion pathway protein G